MESRVKSELVRYARKLHAMGFVANHDGNVSVRAGSDRIWATPTAVSKADVTEEMLVLLDMTGAKLQGRLRPFSEINLHIAAYRARQDVMAVVHAHPPVATGFACAGVPLPQAMMPEAVVSLGASIPTAPYAAPGSAAASAIEPLLREHDAMLLASHGALAVGKDLEQAYLRLELVEHYAKIAQVALSLGGPRALPAADLHKLLEARAKAGLGPKVAAPTTAASPSSSERPGSSAASAGAKTEAPAASSSELLRVIAEEVAKALRSGR